MPKAWSILSVVVVGTSACPTAGASVIVVGPGESIASAVNNAANGDIIELLPGDYQDVVVFIQGKQLTIRGAEGPKLTNLWASTGNNNAIFSTSDGAQVTFEGLTFRGGSQNYFLNLLYVGNGSSSTLVSSCAFRDSGRRAINADNSLTVAESHFSDVAGGITTGDTDVNLVVERCTFESLSPPVGFGALVCSSAANVTVTDSAFVDTDGSAIAINTGSSFSIAGCSFEGNTASNGAAIATERPVTVTNCVFDGNVAVERGGAIWFRASGSLVSSSVFVNNFVSAGLGGAIYSDAFTAPVIINSILRDNAPFQISDGLTLTRVIHSNIEGGWDMPLSYGNIDADPLFVDPDNGDYHLQAGSPCIDAGHNFGPQGEQADFEGNPRFADDPVTTDSGCGFPPLIDMGTFEYQGIAGNVNYGDLSGDGEVGVADLLEMLGSWGLAIDEMCELADLDFDNVVGIEDLLVVLARWGEPP